MQRQANSMNILFADASTETLIPTPISLLFPLVLYYVRRVGGSGQHLQSLKTDLGYEAGAQPTPSGCSWPVLGRMSPG